MTTTTKRRTKLSPLPMAFALALAAAALGGCASMDQQWVQFGDPELQGLVQVEQARATRVPGSDLLEVQVPIRNLSAEQLQLLVQVEFHDATGAPYNDETTRQVWVLPRGTTKTFSATSQKARASDFVIRIWRNRAG